MTDSLRLEAALLALTQSVQTLIEETRGTNASLNSLVEHLYTRNDVVANDVIDIKNELYEFKEVFKQQALTADRYASAAEAQALAAQAQAESAKVQADTAKTQAENIRLMIEMLNRKQA
jgi:DNA-binding protein H-NS